MPALAQDHIKAAEVGLLARSMKLLTKASSPASPFKRQGAAPPAWGDHAGRCPRRCSARSTQTRQGAFARAKEAARRRGGRCPLPAGR